MLYCKLRALKRIHDAQMRVERKGLKHYPLFFFSGVQGHAYAVAAFPHAMQKYTPSQRVLIRAMLRLLKLESEVRTR